MDKCLNVYEELDDKKLHSLAINGDTLAMNDLLARYSSLVSTIAGGYFINGGDRDDLIQEGMIGLFSAIRNYDTSKERSSFRYFAELCIKRRIISALKSANTFGNFLLNDSVSLDENEDSCMLSTSVRYVEDSVISSESDINILEQLQKMLSDKEYKILMQYLEGHSYSDIAANCGYSVKSVDNALHRIRKKSLCAVKNGVFSNSADAIY